MLLMLTFLSLVVVSGAEGIIANVNVANANVTNVDIVSGV